MAKTKKITKASLSEKKQVHGALPESDVDNVYAAMGKYTFPYKEKTLEDYRAALDKMNLADLQRHAVEIANIIPTAVSRSQLVNKLESEYLHKRAAYINKKNVEVNKPTKLSETEEKQLRDLFSRAK